MRAVQITEETGPDTALKLVELPEPEASHMLTPGEGVLVEVHAAGVSFPELLQTRGAYQMKPPLPFVPGSEVGGVVISAPEGAAVKAGDRVAAFCALGAAGGVGTASLQVAKGLGAKTIGTVSTEEKKKVAEQAGADHVVMVAEGWKDEVIEISGGGVDMVLDPVGGDRFLDSLRSLAEDGRLVVVGFTGGSIPEVKVNRLLLKNTEVIGAGWGAYVMGKPDMNRKIGAAISELIDAGFVRPLIGQRFPLEDAAKALHTLDERRALGKVVLDVRPG